MDSQAIQFYLLSIATVAFIVGVPVMLVWSAVSYFRGKGSDRLGSGGASAFVGAGLREIDRLLARPSVEHQIETENQVQLRESDADGE